MAMAHTLDSFPDTGNLENLKDNYQKITSVLAGHQIAFWEYDIPTGECNFTDEYFHILGLKEAGIIFRDINDFYRFAHPEDVISYQTTFARMLESETKISQIVVRCRAAHHAGLKPHIAFNGRVAAGIENLTADNIND